MFRSWKSWFLKLFALKFFLLFVVENQIISYFTNIWGGFGEYPLLLFYRVCVLYIGTLVVSFVSIGMTRNFDIVVMSDRTSLWLFVDNICLIYCIIFKWLFVYCIVCESGLCAFSVHIPNNLGQACLPWKELVRGDFTHTISYYVSGIIPRIIFVFHFS